MKLGIIVDSSCGLTKTQANERGWGYLPLIMNINGKDIQDGIEINSKDFYAKLSINDEVRTSATPPALIVEEFEKFSKNYDFVIAYGISTELSSQSNNMKAFAKDFENVYVVNSKSAAELIIRDLEDLLEIAKKGATKEQLIETIEDYTSRSYGLVLPETLKWLVKGGRISPSVAGMAKLLKIVPIIKFEHGKLEKHDTSRVFKKAVVSSAVNVFKASEDEEIILIHGDNKDIVEITAAIEAEIKKEVTVKILPSVIALHTGPGVVGMVTRKKR